MLERAARPTGGLGQPALGSCLWAAPVLKDESGAPDRWRIWSGGARRTDVRSRVSALGAPHNHHIKGLNERMFVGWERAA